MNALKNKLKKTGGFTLIEMLIVVAIVAILVAISFPIASVATGEAQKSADRANMRAAKTAAILKSVQAGDGKFQEVSESIYYADTGEVGSGTDSTYGKCTNHDGAHVLVSVDTNGKVSAKWSKGAETDCPN